MAIMLKNKNKVKKGEKKKHAKCRKGTSCLPTRDVKASWVGLREFFPQL